MESIPISEQGYERVMQELERLKQERPGVIQAIKEAREEGDLSENAGYDAARERQGMLEAKISYLESRIPRFNVLDPASMGGEKAVFGATVKVIDVDTDLEKVFLLVGPDETDFVAKARNPISVFSPVGRALLGKEEGDEIIVEVPRGRITYEVLDIRFEGAFMDSGNGK